MIMVIQTIKAWICILAGTAESFISNLKNWLCLLTGAASSAIAVAFGGWTVSMKTLLFCMGVDFASGLILAIVFKKSKKSSNGGAESHACLKGILKKVVMLLAVMVGYRLDLVIGTDYIKNTVIIAFIVNEVISFLENAGLMGISLPKVLYKAIDVLKDKEESQ